MGEYPAAFIVVVSTVEEQPMTTVIEGAADDSSLR
jgi:hypothetical protein